MITGGSIFIQRDTCLPSTCLVPLEYATEVEANANWLNLAIEIEHIEIVIITNAATAKANLFVSEILEGWTIKIAVNYYHFSSIRRIDFNPTTIFAISQPIDCISTLTIELARF
jgi:hypothetical protein